MFPKGFLDVPPVPPFNSRRYEQTDKERKKLQSGEKEQPKRHKKRSNKPIQSKRNPEVI